MFQFLTLVTLNATRVIRVAVLAQASLTHPKLHTLSQGCVFFAFAKMAASSFPWFVNPWEGAHLGALPVAPDGVGGAPAPVLVDFDGDDPLVAAVDTVITAAADSAADAEVVRLLTVMGVCGDAAISLIASSTQQLDAVANEVLGANHTAAAAAALRRVWLAAKLPGCRQLTDLSRRLIPPTCLPAGTRAVSLRGHSFGGPVGTQSVADNGGGRVNAAPTVVAVGRCPSSVIV